jgi:hypothetical protein
MTPETISFKCDLCDRLHELEVEERVYADRTCGQWESGWRAYLNGVEFFVSDSGVVWRQPENVEAGIAPEIKAASDRFEFQMAGFTERGIPFGYENDLALD